MSEIYTITVAESRIAFTPRKEQLPEYVFAPSFDPAQAHANVSLVCRMGSPSLAHCVIFRKTGEPGGIFAMHDGEGFLFAAVAETNLAYALAKGFFGELTTNARAGVDIFEDTDNGDD